MDAHSLVLTRELSTFEDEGKFYRAYSERPIGLQVQVNGNWHKVTHSMDSEGSDVISTTVVCEDCWEEIPKYIDFPRGLVSPESDGDLGGNFVKSRATITGGLDGIEHMQKVVCLPCYKEAYKRTYPKAKLPKLSEDIMEEKQIAKLPPVLTDIVYVDEPRTL